MKVLEKKIEALERNLEAIEDVKTGNALALKIYATIKGAEK